MEERRPARGTRRVGAPHRARSARARARALVSRILYRRGGGRGVPRAPPAPPGLHGSAQGSPIPAHRPRRAVRNRLRDGGTGPGHPCHPARVGSLLAGDRPGRATGARGPRLRPAGSQPGSSPRGRRRGVALGASAAAIALAGGVSAGPAFGAWVLLALRGVTAVLYVRARLRLDRGVPAGTRGALASHAAAIAVSAGLAGAGFGPWLGVLAFGILLLRAPHPRSARGRLSPERLSRGVASSAMIEG